MNLLLASAIALQSLVHAAPLCREHPGAFVSEAGAHVVCVDPGAEIISVDQNDNYLIGPRAIVEDQSSWFAEHVPSVADVERVLARRIEDAALGRGTPYYTMQFSDGYRLDAYRFDLTDGAVRRALDDHCVGECARDRARLYAREYRTLLATYVEDIADKSDPTRSGTLDSLVRGFPRYLSRNSDAIVMVPLREELSKQEYDTFFRATWLSRSLR